MNTKRATIRNLVVGLSLLLMSLLAACSTEAIPEDAFSELEAIADANGDIEFDLDIQLLQESSESSLSPQYYVITLQDFKATTPKGKSLEGIIGLPQGSELNNLEQAKVRGKVTKLNDQKLFSGFVIANGGGLGIVPLIAYPEGANFNTGKKLDEAFSSNAEFVKREDGLIVMVTRSQEAVLMSIISEDLGFDNRRTKEQVQLQLTAQIDGLVSQAEAAITLDNGIKFSAGVSGYVLE